MGAIQKRVNKDGLVTYQARIRRTGYGQQIATFSRKTDAQEWLRQEEDKVRRGIHLPGLQSERHTFTELIDRYVREDTVTATKRTHLQRWLALLQDRFLTSITPPMIQSALWELKGKKLFCGGKLAPGSLNRHLDALSCVFRHAKRIGWMTENPVHHVERFTEPKGRVRYLSDEERNRLLDACRQSSYKPLLLIVLLALSTGMRKEELLSLTWEAVDVLSGTIILTKTKNKERRRVPVRGKALDELRVYARVRRLDSNLLFPGANPSPVRSNVVNAKAPTERHFDIRVPWETALAKAKISDFVFHDLRHSCASYLAMNGASPIAIAEVLGHKSLEMVKRYSHLAESHVAEIVEEMNKKIFG